jgi:hypothetical protein
MATTPTSTNPIGKVADAAREKVVDVMLNNPTLAGAADSILGVETRSFGDMLKFYSKNDPDLTKRIGELTADKSYKEIYDRIRTSTEQAIKAGGMADWDSAIKSNGLNTQDINKNLAEKIAYVSTSQVKAALPSSASMFGASLGDIASKSFKKWQDTSFSESPMDWIGSLISGAIHFVQGIISEPGVLENAKQLAKKTIVDKRDDIALKVGGDLSLSNVPDAVKKTVMIEMWTQLGKEGDPSFSISDADKAKKADELMAKLPSHQAARIRAGAADERAPDVQEKAAPPKTPVGDPNEGTISKAYHTAMRWIKKEGEFKNAEGIKGHIYGADPAKEFGITDFVGQMAIGVSTGVAITKKGELLALQEGIMKYNPKAVITFHGEDGKHFDVKKDSYPETIIIGISKTGKKDDANYYYFREPGLSIGNVTEWALDGAKAALTTKGLGAVATKLPLVGRLFGSTAEEAVVLTRAGKAVNLVSPVITNHGLDTLSKLSSGQNYSDTEIGEAVYAGLSDKLVAGGATWIVKRIPTEKIGLLYKTALSHLSGTVSKAAVEAAETAAAKASGLSIKDVERVYDLLITSIKEHKLQAAAVGVAGYATLSHATSTPNGATPPPPPPTPAVAPSTHAPSHFIGDALR